MNIAKERPDLSTLPQNSPVMVDDVTVDLPRPGRSWGILSTIDDMSWHADDVEGRLDEVSIVHKLQHLSFTRLTPPVLAKAIRRRHELLTVVAAIFEQVEKAYGVDRYIIAAIWGIESKYSTMMGERAVVRSTATRVTASRPVSSRAATSSGSTRGRRPSAAAIAPTTPASPSSAQSSARRWTWWSSRSRTIAARTTCSI